MSFDRNIPPPIVRTLTNHRLPLALSSALLLVLSFPNFNQPGCAWIALVPWLVALRGLSSRGAFWWSYLVGAGFFLGSIWWLIHVTLLGWLVLCAYLALYFGAFGWIAHRIVHSPRSTVHSSSVTVDGRRWTVDVLKLFAVPSAWVALEYLRSHLLSGFGWNLLGYSQTPWLALIQMADVTGVWGVSWLIVLVNAALVRVLPSHTRRFAIAPTLLAAGCLVATGLYGALKLTQPLDGTPVRVALVQGNIPQAQKWDEAFRDAILQQYERLTREAAAQHPDLIVWPEASVPGILGQDDVVTTRIQRLAQAVSVPLLVGAPMAVPANGIWRLTNSALLLGQGGSVRARYDKLHLVPFGEFVPFEGLAQWFRDILPPIGDFIPGHHYTVFELEGLRPETRDQRPETRGKLLPQVSGLKSQVSSLRSPFSVLICFEDIFPDLARQFVRRGAQWLITITNDAWFGKTAAAYQHAQASTFRAVELRVPMVRVANTGWSGCIDSRGRWLTSVKDPSGEELFVEGLTTCEVIASASAPSVYRQWGDWFAWLCLLVTGWCIISILPHGYPR